MDANTNRRDFIRAGFATGAAAFAAPWLVPASAFGANDRIVLGGIGVGNQGSGNVRSLSFSLDGRHLATAGADGTIRLYTVDLEELMELACSRVTRPLTEPEWRTYFGLDKPYRETCPRP